MNNYDGYEELEYPEEVSETVKISMNMILHAGDARQYIFKASERMKEFQFEQANELLNQARQELNLAHISQTEYIQREAGGEKMEYSMLFTHAQDTLMTIISEHNMIKQMMEMMKKLVEMVENKGQED